MPSYKLLEFNSERRREGSRGVESSMSAAAKQLFVRVKVAEDSSVTKNVRRRLLRSHKYPLEALNRSSRGCN